MNNLPKLIALVSCTLLCGCATPSLVLPEPVIYDPRKDQALPVNEQWLSDDQEQILRSIAVTLMRETPRTCEEIGFMVAPTESATNYSFTCSPSAALSWAKIASIKIDQAYESGDRVDVNLRLRSGHCANQQTFLWSLWNQPNEASGPNAPLHGPGDWGAYVDNEEFNARIAAHGPMHGGTFCIKEITVIRWAATE